MLKRPSFPSIACICADSCNYASRCPMTHRRSVSCVCRDSYRCTPMYPFVHPPELMHDIYLFCFTNAIIWRRPELQIDGRCGGCIHSSSTMEDHIGCEIRETFSTTTLQVNETYLDNLISAICKYEGLKRSPNRKEAAILRSNCEGPWRGSVQVSKMHNFEMYKMMWCYLADYCKK